MDNVFSFNQIKSIANLLWEEGKIHKLWAWHGEMGSGKTTLIGEICRNKGADGVSSPTFSIINEYQSPLIGVVYHIDLYRVGSIGEAISAGVEDAIHSGDYCFIEWPEKASSLLPKGVFHVFLDCAGESERAIHSYFSQSNS